MVSWGRMLEDNVGVGRQNIMHVVLLWSVTGEMDSDFGSSTRVDKDYGL